MPRNSFDNSLYRFDQVHALVHVYKLKDKFYKIAAEEQSDHVKASLRKIFKIDRARNCLAEPYKTIIDNTFFDKKDLYWWVDFYPKSTYYRLRSKAIKTFLRVFNYDL